jgi:peptidoglycan/xylan/chitin deacetylase (PgdA/CDA1 family)
MIRPSGVDGWPRIAGAAGPADVPNVLTVEADARDRAAVPGLLDVLAAARVRVTFFLGAALAERRPELAHAVRSAGHEVGALGPDRPVPGRTPGEFRADVRAGREALQDALGERVVAFRAPDFSVTPACRWALDVLVEEGFLFDSSIDPARHDPTGVLPTPREPYPVVRPAGTLWEFPPPVWPCLGGPRCGPYVLTRAGLRASNAAGRPFAVNLRARAFDGERRQRTQPRLARLLEDFRFGPLSESVARWCERQGGARRLAA